MVGALSLASCASTVVGWTISGQRSRNSYATLQSAQRLGLDELAPFRVIWFLVPVLVLLVLIGLAQHWWRAVAIMAGTQFLVVCVGAVVVINSPLPVGPGPTVALVVGLPGLLASLALLIVGGRSLVSPSKSRPL